MYLLTNTILLGYEDWRVSVHGIYHRKPLQDYQNPYHNIRLHDDEAD